MTNEQQHHVRNGVIVVRRIIQWIERNEKLTAMGEDLLKQAHAQLERVEKVVKKDEYCGENKQKDFQ